MQTTGKTKKPRKQKILPTKSKILEICNKVTNLAERKSVCAGFDSTIGTISTKVIKKHQSLTLALLHALPQVQYWAKLLFFRCQVLAFQVVSQ